MRFQLATPGGWMGSFIEAASDEEATAIAEAPPYREKVLDVTDSLSGDGKPLTLLVVAGE